MNETSEHDRVMGVFVIGAWLFMGAVVLVIGLGTLVFAIWLVKTIWNAV